MINCVAIDFETANERRSSPCSVGVVVVKNGEATTRFYTLIKPKDNHFCDFNVSIHGITTDDVKDKPEFPEVWSKLRTLLENEIVVAHNASFDMSVLRQTLELYEIRLPELTYTCTRVIAQQAWPGLISYRLNMVARVLGIDFDHHHALHDAWACSEIARCACREKDCDGLNELADCLGVRHGHIWPTGEYCPAGVEYQDCDSDNQTNSRIDLKSIRACVDVLRRKHPFNGRVFAFTGELKSMTRRQAMQAVVDMGGEIGNGVTKHTNYLVVGEQDLRKLAEGQIKSSKMLKAEALLAKGQAIQIVTEQDFLELLEI